VEEASGVAVGEGGGEADGLWHREGAAALEALLEGGAGTYPLTR